jgi:hypothetical protein
MAHRYDQETLVIALKKVAIVMSNDPRGYVYTPIFERLERELAAVQAKDAAVRRAQSLLDTLRPGGA